MPIRTPRLIAAPALILALVSCAALQASQHHRAAKKAEAAGDLDRAARAYEAAAAAAPKNLAYQEDYDAARSAAVGAHAEVARAAEQDGEHAAALAEWKKAIALHPTNPALKARAELAKLRTKRSEPIEFYHATRKLAAALPKDSGTQKALARARDDATKYYIRLAETYADAGAAGPAYEHYQKAHEVDPKHEVFAGSMFRVTKAKHFENVGDQHMKDGDRLAAYRAYEEALTAANLPQLRRKLEVAKRAAGGVLEQLAQARSFEAAEQWEDAAEIYTLLLDRRDAPADMEGAAKIARAKSAQLRLERARAFAERDVLEQAQASLTMALEHTDGDEHITGLLQAGLDALQAGDPKKAKAKFDEAAASNGTLQSVKVARIILQASARALYTDVTAMAQRDPAAAMVRIEKLAPFKKSLPGYGKLRRSLVKSAFMALLDQAESKAAAGDVEAAAELLSTALEVARAPKKIRAPLLAGCHALRSGDYATAEAAFSAVLAKDKRSRIARTGQRIASERRLATLRKQADDAVAVDDTIRAAAAYRQILELKPDDVASTNALAGLRDRLIEASVVAAQEHLQDGRPGTAYVYFKRVLDLEPAHPAANQGVTQAIAGFDIRESPLAWVAPVKRSAGVGDKCAGAEEDLRERLILYLTRTRKLGAEFLQRAQTVAVDGNERPQPTVALRATLERCDVSATGGSLVSSMKLVIGPEVVFGAKVKGVFDKSSVPKDELEDGLDVDRVLDGTLNEAARGVAARVRENAKKLQAWRIIEARARIRAGDGEGAARAYATFRMGEDRLSTAERGALRDLERFILNRFR